MSRAVVAKGKPLKPLPPSARYRWLGPAALLFAITLIAYIPALRGGFVWDDDSYVTGNAMLRSMGGLWRIWTDPWSTPQYYPLVHTSFWIEYHLWGVGSAFGFHLVNVLLHALSAVLLWRLLCCLEVPLAWLAAAIFAVHPVNVESVAWITERKNVLSGMFYLLAFGTYLRAIGFFRDSEEGQTLNVQRPTPNLQRRETLERSTLDVRRWTFAFVFFLLALFSKTVTATFPAAILLVLWWKRGKLHWRDVRPLIPFFVAGIIMSSVTGYLERTHVGAHGPAWSVLTPIDRVLIAGRAVWFYAGKLFVPIHLTFIYPRWHINSHLWWQYLYPAAAVAVVLILWLFRKRLGRGPLTAALFFGGTLLPALGFVNVYPMQFSFVADHFQYLAGIGLIVLFTAVLARIVRKKMVIRPIAVVILVALMTATMLQGRIYRNSLTLWQDTLSKNPNSWMAHVNLGNVFTEQGRHDEAFKQYEKALHAAPEVAETHQTIAYQLAARGDLPGAISQFHQAIQIDPTYAPAYAYLAKAMLSENKPLEAERAARHAIALMPRAAMAHAMLGQALERSGRLVEATAEYTLALQYDRDDADSHFHMGDCLQRLGKPEAAFQEYQAAVALDPKNAPAWTDLGMIYLRAGQRGKAIESFEKALKSDPNLIPARNGLRQASGQ